MATDNIAIIIPVIIAIITTNITIVILGCLTYIFAAPPGGRALKFNKLLHYLLRLNCKNTAVKTGKLHSVQVAMH